MHDWFRTIFLCALCSVVGYEAWTVGESLKQITAGSPKVVTSLDTTLQQINAPCIGFHGSVTCGPLAQLSQTEKNLGILAGQATEQVKQSAVLVNAAATAIRTTSAKINDLADAGTGLLVAGTGTVTQAQADLVTLNGSIAATAPLITNSAATVTDLDDFLRRNAAHFDSTLANVDQLSGSGAKIGNDLYIYSHPILNPDPCKTRRCAFGRFFTDLEGGLRVGAAGADLYHAFQPLGVRIQK